MNEFETLFKSSVDTLKTDAHRRQMLQHQSADIQYQAYCQAVDDVMRAYIDARAEAGND